MVFVHGGCWLSRYDIAHAAALEQAIADSGFAVWSLEYRTRVVASGHSAGGQFALWLAARKKIATSSELYTANPLPIRGVLALAPAPDLEGLHASAGCGTAIDRLMGGSPADHPDRYAAASPMQLAPIAVPQVIIVAAHDESFGPGGRAYFARAKAVGAQATSGSKTSAQVLHAALTRRRSDD